MKLFGSHTAAERDHTAPTLDLSTAGTRALLTEMRSRGWEAFPVGLWSQTLGQLEARAGRAEAKFERAKGLIRAEFKSSHETERRLLRCEHEAELLAEQVIGSEVGALEQGGAEEA